MRARWAVALTATLTALLIAVAGVASATGPVTLGAGYVLDEVGALSSAEQAQTQERLEQLKTDAGLDLWVVFVDEFTDPSDSADWANTTAERNGLGPTQYLLAVATESRQFYLSGDAAGPVEAERLGTIEQTVIQPRLAAGDFAGAVAAAADGLGGAGGGAAGGGFPVGLIVLAVIAVIAGIVIIIVVRRRRKAAAGAQLELGERERRAASALVQTDDAVRTSEQELGFARAQFGDAATGEFEQALRSARADLAAAFTLKQQLDDATADTEEQRREWNAEIIRLCEQANAQLDEKAEAFDELRRLEQNAPQSLARVQEQAAAAAAAVGGAADQLQRLSERYAPAALATIADNPEQARQRLAFAQERLVAAEVAIGAGKGGEAAVGIRAAEEAVGQAALLETAVDTLARDLAEAESGAGQLLIDLEADIAAASALPDPDGRVAAAIEATRLQADAARTKLAGAKREPLAALQALGAADARIDGVIAEVRDAASRAQHARQQLSQQVLQAQGQVSAAEDYITARRGAIGAEARTRLAEAGAALVQAQQLQASHPEQALQHAQRANQLAAAAIRHAQSDVGSFGGAGGGFGGGDGGGMLGAVLGGIVINSMLGGGSSGGSRRSRSPGGFGRSSGGRMTPGSFGGGGTRARRGGGRF